MELLLLLLAAYGFCFGLMNEKVPVLNRALYRLPILRDLDQGTNFFSRMLDCAYCTGFHAGWVVWTVAYLSGGEPFQGWVQVLGDMALFAFASSAFCYSLDTGLRWLER
jgi:hypothetical protein